MAQHVAFLRGINVGGNRIIPMADLRAAFEELGFKNVRTLLASGNVVFDAPMKPGLTTRIEAGLKKAFAADIGVTLRSTDALREMVKSDPFAEVDAKRDSKLYVALLSGPDAHLLPLPCSGPDFDVVGATATDIYIAAWRMPDGRFGPGMDQALKRFKKGVTTRNWNTIVKLIA